ncbi:MAG: TSUP family transporter, partial [Bacteroidota bacterium]|nr:TSUP family transporter [Bacteroidota bacterium]
MIELLGYAAMIGIGVMLGSVGAGGSMLAIPVLVYLFSLDMETASAYSLFLVGATSLTGAAIKRREQLITARAAFMFGIPSV